MSLETRHAILDALLTVKAGSRFGSLTVVSKTDEKAGTHRKWLCQCDCGVEKSVSANNLRRGVTKSCGCYRRNFRVTNGASVGGRASPEYKVWSSMKNRCHNPNDQHFSHYGGRGIKVCDRWRNSFQNFIGDMGSRPPGGYSVEREDNNGDYESGNCRWATKAEQNGNRRDSVRIRHNGEELCLEHWARRLRINGTTLRYRARRLGGNFQAAISHYEQKNGAAA